jgi:hypothetical protein
MGLTAAAFHATALVFGSGLVVIAGTIVILVAINRSKSAAVRAPRESGDASGRGQRLVTHVIVPLCIAGAGLIGSIALLPRAINGEKDQWIAASAFFVLFLFGVGMLVALRGKR